MKSTTLKYRYLTKIIITPIETFSEIDALETCQLVEHDYSDSDNSIS